jgi:putative adhesin
MSPATTLREAEFTRTLGVTGPVTIEASVRSGMIRVRRGEDGEVVIRGALRARGSGFLWGTTEQQVQRLVTNPPIEQNGNSISVGDSVDRWSLRRVDLMVEITAPAATSLRALCDSADLRVRGIDGPVECETDSGEIELASIGSDVRATSDSGTISIYLVAGGVEASADSGDIEALEIAGRIEARTDSGEIHVWQTTPAPLHAESDSGRVTVKLAPTGGYTVRVRTDDGRIAMPEVTLTSQSRHQTEGLIRGGGSVVDIETDSGDIEIV